MDYSTLAKKKVLGVPAIYLAGAFVAILAVVAYKLQTSTPPEADTPVEATTDAGVEEDASIPTATKPFNGSNYHMATDSGGTVVTVQDPVPGVTPEPVVPTNEAWATKAINWLVQTNKAPGGAAQTAITKYLDGASLSYAEGALRDQAVKEFGVPPEHIGTPGTVADAPAQRQFDPAKGSGHHTVKNSNDNTAAKLSSLYYGTSLASSVKAITDANKTLGPGPYTVGAVLLIPDITPAVYGNSGKTVRSRVQVAAANGIPESRLVKFNPGLPAIVPPNTKVRIG